MPPARRLGILRALMRRLASILAVASLALLACKSPCRQLSEKLCECAETTVQRDACRTAAGQREQGANPTAEDQAVCQALLDADQCNCHTLETAETKRACGLAK